MKKHNKVNKLLLLVPFFALSACGYGLKEIYRGDAYNSVDYDLNFYREWDSSINYHKVEMAKEEYELNTVLDDKVFESYYDDNCRSVIGDGYSYENDLGDDDKTKSYSQTYKLSNYNSSFRYGYLSKLFDGQLFCHQKYERARVQIDQNGFGMKFSKELKDFSYFALNFKSSVDYRRDGKNTNIPSHFSSVVIKINFYCKTENGYCRKQFSYPIDGIYTNAGESTSIYKFFGFDLSNYDISRCTGFSVEYDLVKDDYIEEHKEDEEYIKKPLTHCLLLYEMLLPDSTWH